MLRSTQHDILLVFFILVFFSFPAYAAVPPQTLIKGQSATIALDYVVGDIAIADHAIADYMVAADRHQIYLNAREAGETSLTIWDDAGTKRDEVAIAVYTSTLKDAVAKAREAMAGLDGVELHLQGGNLVVSGEVTEPEAYQQIESFANSTPRVVNRVKLASTALATKAKEIQAEIGAPNIHVRAIQNHLVLDGVAYSQAQMKRAVEIAQLHDHDVKNLIEVMEKGRQLTSGPQIFLDVHMMEIKKSALRRFGISWTPGAFPRGEKGNIAAGGGAGGGLLADVAGLGREVIGFVVNLLPKIHFAREHGDGRVLENPSVVVKSGEAADLFSGTEVPYLHGEQTQFKEIGIAIHAEPIATADGIDVKISATLSAPSASLDGGIDRNTVTTTALCRADESLVLAKIFRDGDVKMKNRLPKDLDTSTALFSLVASRDFQSHRSEFVIFITPRIVEQPTPAEAELQRWLETDQQVMHDRSPKEERAYLAEKGLLPDVDKPKSMRHGRWQ